MSDRYLSWPAVSHSCSLMVSLSICSVLVRKSIPTVGLRKFEQLLQPFHWNCHSWSEIWYWSCRRSGLQQTRSCISWLLTFSKETSNVIIHMTTKRDEEYEMTDICQTPAANLVDEPENYDVKYDTLQNINFYAYGLGHFFNDLTASFWFKYQLTLWSFAIFFLVNVVKTNVAGFAFLMGQLADSLFTPLAGYLCDNVKTKYGHKTFWYSIGFITCVVSFPMIFRNVKTG